MKFLVVATPPSIYHTPPPVSPRHTPTVVPSPPHHHTRLGLPSPHPPPITCPTSKLQLIHVPDELGMSLAKSSSLFSTVGFHTACVCTRDLPELADLPSTAPRGWDPPEPPAPQCPISTTAVMNTNALCHTKFYKCHVLASWYTTFNWDELEAHTAMGHDILLPWAAVHVIPSIYISLVGLIPQEDRHPLLIYD